MEVLYHGIKTQYACDFPLCFPHELIMHLRNIYIYIYAKPTTLVVVWALWPHIALRSLDVRMTAIVPQAVVTDYRLSINSCHAISRLYQATLMSCGTAKHVSVDCTIYIWNYCCAIKFKLWRDITWIEG